MEVTRVPPGRPSRTTGWEPLPQKNKVVVYLASHNAKGSSGNIVENVEDEECYNFILLKCPTTNKNFKFHCI